MYCPCGRRKGRGAISLSQALEEQGNWDLPRARWDRTDISNTSHRKKKKQKERRTTTATAHAERKSMRYEATFPMTADARLRWANA